METIFGFALSKKLLPSSLSSDLDELLYLTGLKGLFVLQSFIWVYLHTLVPTLVSAQSSDLDLPGTT